KADGHVGRRLRIEDDGERGCATGLGSDEAGRRRDGDADVAGDQGQASRTETLAQEQAVADIEPVPDGEIAGARAKREDLKAIAAADGESTAERDVEGAVERGDAGDHQPIELRARREAGQFDIEDAAYRLGEVAPHGEDAGAGTGVDLT